MLETLPMWSNVQPQLQPQLGKALTLSANILEISAPTVLGELRRTDADHPAALSTGGKAKLSCWASPSAATGTCASCSCTERGRCCNALNTTPAVSDSGCIGWQRACATQQRDRGDCQQAGTDCLGGAVQWQRVSAPAGCNGGLRLAVEMKTYRMISTEVC